MLNAIFFPKVEPIFNGLYVPEILEDIYIKGSYSSIFNGRHDMVIIDAGANIGMTAQYFRQFGKVYSIEPSPENFEALKQNKEYNGWDNVEIFNVALSDKVGEAEFNISSTNHTANSLHKWIPHENYFDDNVKVRTIDIETFFKLNNITTVDFLKMDIEASEDAVLQSEAFKSVVPNIKAMLVEFHNPGWERLLTLIESWGFYSHRLNVPTVSYLFSREDLWL